MKADVGELLKKLSKLYGVVELEFVRVESDKFVDKKQHRAAYIHGSGDHWWGVRCKYTSDDKKWALSIGGYPTVLMTLREAMKVKYIK